MLGEVAQIFQGTVVLLALGEELRKEVGNEVLELIMLVSGDGRRKKSNDDTDELNGVGGIVDVFELD